MEKYVLNSYQFSAAKSKDEAKRMQKLVYSDDGKLRAYNDFKADAEKIQKTINENWLRVERDMCVRSSILADKWADMVAEAEFNPYWIYSGRMDSKERREHVALEGLVFRIGDPYGDRMCPPEDWNCRCRPKQVDDQFLRKNNRSVQTDSQAKGWLEGVDEKGKPFVDEQFRYNPYQQGMLPNKGDYFDEFRNANAGNSSMFGKKAKGDGDLDHLASRKFTNVLKIVEDWKDEYHVDNLGDIIFQNPVLKSNVALGMLGIHNVHAHPRGAEQIPKAISNPDEVWSRWENPDNQDIVLRNYILFGSKMSYIVNTKNGVILDAKMVSNSQAEKSRIGCPWFKTK